MLLHQDSRWCHWHHYSFLFIYSFVQRKAQCMCPVTPQPHFLFVLSVGESLDKVNLQSTSQKKKEKKQLAYPLKSVSVPKVTWAFLAFRVYSVMFHNRRKATEPDDNHLPRCADSIESCWRSQRLQSASGLTCWGNSSQTQAAQLLLTSPSPPVYLHPL